MQIITFFLTGREEHEIQKYGTEGISHFNYVFLTIAGLICLLPFINLLAVSLSSSSAVAAGSVSFIPKEFTLSSYKFVLESARFMKAFWVSIKRVLLGVSINMLVMICTAYPLSKSKRQLMGKSIYTWYFVITMLIGGGLIPTYLVIVKLRLIDTIWSLVLPGALPVYNMIILMNFFKSTPEELEEAGSDRQGRRMDNIVEDCSADIKTRPCNGCPVLHCKPLEFLVRRTDLYE